MPKFNICMLTRLTFIYMIFINPALSQGIQQIKKYKEVFCIRSFAFSRVSYMARLSHNYQTIHIENMLKPNHKIISFGHENGGIKFLTFDNSEKYLAASSHSGIVDVWDINNKILYRNYKIHEGAVNIVAFVPQTTFLISAGNDGNMFLIDIQNPNAKPKFIGQHQSIIRSIDISENGRFMVSAGHDRKAMLWDINKYFKVKESVVLDNLLSSIRLYKDKIIVGDMEGYIVIFDSSMQIKRKFRLHQHLISAISVLSNDTFITSSYDGYIKKSNFSGSLVENLYHSKNYNKDHNYIMHLSLSEDKKKIAFSDRIGNMFLVKITDLLE